MSTEKRSSNNDNDRSNSTSKNSDQQNERTDRKSYDSKSDQKDSRMNTSKSGRGGMYPATSDRDNSRNQNQLNSSGKKDVDSDRNPEEQVIE